LTECIKHIPREYDTLHKVVLSSLQLYPNFKGCVDFSVMGDSLNWVFRMVILDHIQVLFFLQALEGFYENFDADFIPIRTKAREVLQREDDLNEIVQVKKHPNIL
jgi:hypothetical protein